MDHDDPNLCFMFQVGLMRDQVSIDRSQLTLGTLKDLACSFINRKFPGHGLGRLSERLILFRHEYSNSNQLVLINSASEITGETLVEIVLNANLPAEEQTVIIRPHELYVHSYRTPTFCDFCGEMLFGLIKQGLQCRGCNQNFHKRCVSKIPNDCHDPRRRPSNLLPVPLQSSASTTCSTLSGYLSEDTFSLPSSRSPSLAPPKSPTLSAGRGCWTDGRLTVPGNGLKIPHTFVVHTYTRPTMCFSCKKLLKGLLRQGMQCRDCKLNVHKKCSERIQSDCIGEVPRENQDGDGERDGIDETESDEADNDSPPGSQGKSSPRPPHSVSDQAINGQQEYDGEDAEHDLQKQPSNIPVQRLWQSVKHTKRRGSQVIKEGWMIHCTNKDPNGRLHYWRLDSKSITLFNGETNKNFYKEIPLSEILAVETAKSVANGGSSGAASMVSKSKKPEEKNYKKGTASVPTHCFELRTANVDYYVGQDKPRSVTGRAEPEGVLAAPLEKGVGTHLAKSWETAIRQALMPVTPQSSVNVEPKADAPATNGATGRTPKESIVSVPPGRERASDIRQLYEIIPDEVLGSGQFGTVYGGTCRKNGRSVAIKIIDKTRFPHKNEAQLKNEVAILQEIAHPAVVNLESMFETPERIFVVMEKLKGDMLEMILSSPKGRLSERITRFLISQILVALKHLHSKNIVHCDLKPENVLLSEDTDFPQVKLCDFGFARIIGEKSFRRSVVGTPAYLAPEVLRNKKYNRSLDMWSVGVIIYVSLSGTFPFNEEEDIHDQIKNAAFMYPPNPWKEISTVAIDLINNLLQVQASKRYTVDKTMIHPWLQDYHTWCDSRELENKVGIRYITHESDDDRWEQYRRRHANDGNEANMEKFSQMKV